MILKQWIILGTITLIAIVNCEHIIQKRDLELPKEDDILKLSSRRALHEKVTPKHLEHHKKRVLVAHFTPESSHEKSSRILSRNVLLSKNNGPSVALKNLQHASALQRALTVQYLEKNYPSSKTLSSNKLTKKRSNREKERKTHSQRKDKKYVIPNALFAWKQRQQPLYLTPRVFFNKPTQPKAIIDAQRYYGYQQGKNWGLSNAARVAAWQAYQKSRAIKMASNTRPVNSNPQLPSYTHKPYGLVFANVPPAGLGRLPQTQQKFNQRASKEVFTKGSQVSKVFTPLYQVGVTTLTGNGKAQQFKTKNADKAPLKGKEEKEEKRKSKHRGQKKAHMKKKNYQAHKRKASQRNLIKGEEDNDITEGSEDSNETSMDSKKEDDAYTGEEEKKFSETGNASEESQSQGDPDESNSEEDKSEEETESDDSNETKDDDDESKDDASGVSRSNIEQDQDGKGNGEGDGIENEESQEGDQNKDTENEEDGIQEGENSESEIFPSPEEAPQYAQELDGPVDPANSPARDTGDDNTPPAPEETFTSRSMIDDIFSTLV